MRREEKEWFFLKWLMFSGLMLSLVSFEGYMLMRACVFFGALYLNSVAMHFGYRFLSSKDTH